MFTHVDYDLPEPICVCSCARQNIGFLIYKRSCASVNNFSIILIDILMIEPKEQNQIPSQHSRAEPNMTFKHVQENQYMTKPVSKRVQTGE